MKSVTINELDSIEKVKSKIKLSKNNIGNI